MFNILNYGAKEGGKILCTAAIQKAIDECFLAGGGIVTVPAGTYLTGTIWLKSHIELHLEAGAVLRGSADLKDYNDDDLDEKRDTDYPQNFSCAEEEWRGKHLIIAHECEDVALTGKGCVDGAADDYFEDVWFAEHKHDYWYPEGWCWSKDKVNLRPGQVIVFAECKNVLISDITVCNAPCWDIFLHGCDNVRINGVYIHNPRYFINTDGIDIDCCSYVTVSNCVIDTADDCITFRANPERLSNKDKKCEYITVTNCTLSTTCFAFRVGVGTGTVEHIRVSNISVSRAATPIAFTPHFGENETNIRDVNFNNISAGEVSFPCRIEVGKKATFSDITIENYRSYSYGQLFAVAEDSISDNIILRNIECHFVDKGVELSKEIVDQRGNALALFKNMSGLTVDGMKLCCEADVFKGWQKAIEIDNCPKLKLNNIELP